MRETDRDLRLFRGKFRSRPGRARGRRAGVVLNRCAAMMKLSFGMKAKRQKFATQLADDEEDEEEKELKRLKSERMP